MFVSAFESSGFTGSINWYRNLDRNWHLLADVNSIIQQPTLMIYGDRDVIPKSKKPAEFVPNVEVVTLDCGHWIGALGRQATGILSSVPPIASSYFARNGGRLAA